MISSVISSRCQTSFSCSTPIPIPTVSPAITEVSSKLYSTSIPNVTSIIIILVSIASSPIVMSIMCMSIL